MNDLHGGHHLCVAVKLGGVLESSESTTNRSVFDNIISMEILCERWKNTKESTHDAEK